MSTTTNNLSEVNQFIEALFSRYFTDNDSHVELRFVGQDTGSKFYPQGKIDNNDWADILKLNQDHHVYVGVNPRPLSKNKKQDDIEDIVCLWADLDGKDFDGGKPEAERRLRGFSIPPSIAVDSGHGFHCYWVLEEPIIGLTADQRVQVKQILSGLIKELGADRSKLHLDACLRLPGTVNIKNPEAPIECRILNLSGQVFNLDVFSRFTDCEFHEPPSSDTPLPVFGSKTKIISLDDAQSAKADVEALEISSKTKNLIITGSLLRGNDADRTRSGRDFSIICSLIYWDYDYRTIHSIFFNPLLGCSNRISAEGENALKWDIQNALRKVHKRLSEGTPQSARITAIKSLKHLTSAQKCQEIGAFIVRDLLTGPEAAGRGFKHQTNENAYYFFDKEEKMLMTLESIDFYCYMRERFGLAKKDFEEFKDAVKTAIWSSKQTVVPRRFAYWNQDEFTLHVSDNANGVYKLDGMGISLCDNGENGVFFEYDPSLSPFAFHHDLAVVNYFEDPEKPGTVDLENLGLNIDQFNQDGCLVKRFLIDRASFAQGQETPLSPEEQKMLLIIYFYSLFFESQMREKPVACFIGTKESGKSFLASSIGKIFFGDQYESTGLPKSPHDLAVVMDKRPYLVIDNLDSYLKSEMLNLLCAVATGVTEANRELYTDNSMIWFTPHCFLAITSREPKFTRDDFVSRLLLFNMRKIDNPLSRSELSESLLLSRSEIMTEVLVNLNSIVKILLLQEDRKLSAGKAWEPTRCYSRLADWETFGRKICSPSTRPCFISTIQSMNQTKDDFVLEDDLFYQVLYFKVYEEGCPVRELSAQGLYSEMIVVSKDMDMEGFAKRYRNARSMAKHLANIVSELKQKFEVEIIERSGRKKFYSFKAIEGEEVITQEIAKAIEKPADEGIKQPTTEDPKVAIVRKILELQAKNPNAKVLSRKETEDADFKRWEREEKRRQTSVNPKEDEEDPK